MIGRLPPSSDLLQPFPEYSKMLENSQNGEKGPISMVFLLFPSNGLNRTSLPKFTFLILTKNHSAKTFGILDVTVIDFPYL